MKELSSRQVKDVPAPSGSQASSSSSAPLGGGVAGETQQLALSSLAEVIQSLCIKSKMEVTPEVQALLKAMQKPTEATVLSLTYKKQKLQAKKQKLASDMQNAQNLWDTHTQELRVLFEKQQGEHVRAMESMQEQFLKVKQELQGLRQQLREESDQMVGEISDSEAMEATQEYGDLVLSQQSQQSQHMDPAILFAGTAVASMPMESTVAGKSKPLSPSKALRTTVIKPALKTKPARNTESLDIEDSDEEELRQQQTVAAQLQVAQQQLLALQQQQGLQQLQTAQEDPSQLFHKPGDS